MPRKESEAVPEGNGLVPQQEQFGSDQPTMADVYRMIEELFDRSDRKFDELTGEMRGTRRRVASLEEDARQPRLAMEADGPSDTKTRERTEGAAKAVQAMHGKSFSANRVDPDPMCLTSFGVKAELPDHPCRDDVLVENGAAAAKLCLSPWRCAHQQPPVAYSPPAKFLQRGSSFISRVFGCAQPRKQTLGGRQFNTPCTTTGALVEPASCPLLAEGYKNKIKAKSYIRYRRFQRSSARPPVFGNVARFTQWGVSRFGAAGGDLQHFSAERMT